MTLKIFRTISIFLLMGMYQSVFAQSTDQNIITHDNIENTIGWYGNTTEVFDSTQSHETDGSGSFRMNNAIVDDTPGYQYVVSKTYAVEPGKLYDLSYFAKSDVLPAAKASVFLNLRDVDVQWVENSPTLALSVTQVNEWQQVTSEIRIPDNVHFAQAFVFVSHQNAERNGQVWFDSFAMVKQPYAPHLIRNLTDNLVIDAKIEGTTGWSVSSSGLYDATESRNADGSGSFKLTNAYIDTTEGYDYAVSRMYPVAPDKLYTLSAFIKSDNFPGAAVGMFINFRDADGQWVKNSPSDMQSVANVDEWQEVAIQFRVPDGAVFAQIFAFITRQHTESNSQVWFDDFYIGEGVSFEKPPTEKIPFNGNQTRIDRLGNVEIKRGGQWQPFIPLCIHGDNLRPDWSIYSIQGFNCNMWAGSHLYVQKAKDAASDFNPDGMMSGLQISNFIVPGHTDYNNLPLLNTRMDDIVDAGLSEHLLFYYWDNEHAEVSEWNVPLAVSNSIKQKNTGHPIFMLQDNQGITRKYKTSVADMIDVTGDYINVNAYRDYNGFDVLTNLEQQTVPLTIAQLNYTTGLRFRARVYSAIAHGAKGFSMWRDNYTVSNAESGPVEQAAWWSMIPAIRTELDTLTPLIRQPHWTEWTVKLSENKLDFGTRNFEGKGFIILANEHDHAITSNLVVENLDYTATRLVNYLTSEIISVLQPEGFNVIVPAYGSLVIQLIE